MNFARRFRRCGFPSSGNLRRFEYFCAFAVTLLARPKKLDVGDHGCFASPSCGDQSITGRKVVLIGFFGNLHRRFLIKSPCRAPPPTPQARKLQRLAFTCAGCTHQQDIKRGRDHRFPTRAQKGKKYSTASPPSCTPAPRSHLPVQITPTRWKLDPLHASQI